MQKQNMSPIDTGRWQKHKVGNIGVPKDCWDIAWDPFFCRIHCAKLYPVKVDKLSKESYNEAYEILSAAIMVFDVSKAASHTVSIRIFRVVLTSTENHARGLPIHCPSPPHWSGLWSSERSICYYISDRFEWSPPTASKKASNFWHIQLSSFRLQERSMTETIDSLNVLTINLDTEKDVAALVTIGQEGKNLFRKLKA